MDDFNSEEAASGDPCFYYEIPGGLLDKDVIEITGYFYGEKIVIEVLAETYNRDGQNTALPLQFTLTKTGKWTTMTYTQSVPRQIKSGSTIGSENFQIRIVALDSSFEIFLNGAQLCTQKHLVPLPQVTHISIDGDAEFTGVEFKDLVSENDASARSDHLSTANEYGADLEVAPGFTRLSENRRSSNRKPKPPVVVPTQGSFRVKPSLATTREEPDTYVNTGEGSSFAIKAAPASQIVMSSADPTVETFAASGFAASGKRGSNLSLSGKRNSTNKLGSREKLQTKWGSRGSVNTPVSDGHGYVTGSMEDVWVEEGGPEFSADGAGAFTVAGAASVPNLSSQIDKGKEKKRFGILHGGRKSHSTSSPPGEGKLDEREKKKHKGGLLFGKGGKKEKEPKADKGPKKLPFGRKSSKHGSTKDVSSAGTELFVPEVAASSDYDNPSYHLDTNKPTLISMAQKRSKTGVPTSPLSDPRNSLMGSHGRGSYDIDLAERTYDIHHGTYQRTSADRGLSLSGDIDSSIAAGIGVSGAMIDDHHDKKFKGSSSNIAAKLMDGSAGKRGSTEYFTRHDPSLDIPLRLERHEGAEAAAAGVVAVTTKEEHRKKEKGPKLKGASAEIADDLLGNNRGMSSEFVTYTGSHMTVPLKLNSEDLLSVNEKGFTPIIGPKGSYNLETVPNVPTGVYQPRADVSWAEEPAVIQKSASMGVQHSKPPGVEIGGGAVLPMPTPALSKEKKNLLKGESAEIASNLFDEEGVKNLRKSFTMGYPLCGETGFNMPWKIDASNRDAQPVPYNIRSPNYSSRLKDRSSFGDEYAISASIGNNVHAAAPLSGSANLYETKSATFPQPSAGGASVALSEGAVVIVSKDKKGRQGHEDDDKERKHHRVSGFFRRIFRRKRKSGASQSEEEYGVSEGVGTEFEMTEYRTSSQQSFEFDGYEADFTVTAKPDEVCLFASQMRGDKPALNRNSQVRTMCDGDISQVPLQITTADIPADIALAGTKLVSTSAPFRRQSTDSLRSWSTVSPGGSRRIYHRSSKHRPDSASSWSSISPGGTRRHRTRADSLDTWKSTTPGGSRRIYHLSDRHRPESASSWSSVSPGGTRRHRRRDDTSLGSIFLQHQELAYAANERDQLFDSYFNIQKQETGAVHASYPQQLESTHSSSSSIPSLYGRVVVVGQSPGFRTRIQSYRKKMEMPKKSKRSSDRNGFNSGSDSSISSIASDRLLPAVVKARGGEYAIFVENGETIFEEHPPRKEDVYANNTSLYGSTR